MSRHFIATAPSNIALLKYWGKRPGGRQWPANDSLSMTLKQATTTTIATPVEAADHSFHFDESNTQAWSFDAQNKALSHLRGLSDALGFSGKLALRSSNSFPTACGIASSASGMAALTISAVAAWTGSRCMADLHACGFDLQRLANLARLGSGSACRSFLGGFVTWDAGVDADAQSVTQLHPAEHWRLADLIVVVDSTAKHSSSTAAHAHAWSSPLFGVRLAGLPAKMQRLKAALTLRDWPALGVEIEAEALEMHAVMLSAKPATNYLSSPSTALMAWLREVRVTRGLHAYFTVDAGPNVHILCAPDQAPELETMLREQFPEFPVIRDEVGGGPSLRCE